MVKPVSPYLQRPLRSLEEALRELGQETPPGAGQAKPAPATDAPAKPGATQDSVTIAGVEVAVEPPVASGPATGGQLDVKA